MPFSRPDSTSSARSRVGVHPHVIHGPWTNLTQHPKLHLDRFSRFRTAHDRESLYFTMFD